MLFGWYLHQVNEMLYLRKLIKKLFNVISTIQRWNISLDTLLYTVSLYPHSQICIELEPIAFLLIIITVGMMTNRYTMVGSCNSALWANPLVQSFVASHCLLLSLRVNPANILEVIWTAHVVLPKISQALPGTLEHQLQCLNVVVYTDRVVVSSYVIYHWTRPTPHSRNNAQQKWE